MDPIEASRFTSWLESGVTILQSAIAAFLVVLLLLGVVNLAVTIGESILVRDVTDTAETLSLVRSAIDIVLYLFVIVELYHTVVAYVEAQSVVLAVIHAGLIAVVRQIITFKPDDYGSTEAITFAGVYALLLAALLVGFWVVHRQIEAEAEAESELA
ncbi:MULTISPECIES: phosphate-starvation-inducible PsiE family protein [Halorussus]|uniref:phosphate-starvation-inducible PsiE family protein n=1 Tax=Halorussus TaxID=1070314 RepID=UPI000E20F208|nr:MULTISPECIES: phosphate-starvation-inducible PsiE family protein [Halorussus]NHN59895.1 phosphate-starvation-inducible PsiE family protein [Halorussus sp. JP-T4]